MTAQPGLTLRLLGRFEAVMANETRLRITSKKGIALLAYLALHPDHAVSRERLATLLWGDRPDRQARLSLRQCIMSLRTAMAPAPVDLLVLEGDAVGLRMDQIAVDALEFNGLSQSSALADLEKAADLYRGEFLCDLGIETEVFDSWARSVRARFEATAAFVLQVCVERFDAANEGVRAIAAGERLVAFDPLREDRQRLLLRIYSRHQGVSAALSHAETLINLLKNELGAAPEPETTVLIEEIRRGVAASADQPQTIRPAAFAAASADMANIAPPPPLLPAEQSVSFLADDSRSPVSPRPGRPVTIPSPFWQRTLKKWPTAAALTFILLLAGSLGQDQLLSARPDPSIDISQTPILVLPFTSLTDGNEANATADGISNHLINALSVIGKFRVISGATSHQYRGRSKDIKAVSHELGIRYAVDGNIQLDGDKMRVSAELIDTLSSLQIWSDQFEGDSAQRFSTNEIVRGIARALQVNVIEVEGRNAAWQKPAKAGIGGLLATGWSSLVASGRETRLAEAKAAFDEALRRSPDDAGAMLGLAAYHLIAVSELAVATEPSLSEAEGLLDKVLQRRPGLSPVYFYRSVLQAFRGQPQLALKSVEHCLAINPSFAPGYAHMGAILTWLDRVDEAVDRIGYAIRLSPKDPSLSTWYILAGWAELQRGHDAAAFEWLFRSAALDPNGALLEGSLAVAYALAGDRPNAEQHAIRFRTLTPAVTEERRLDRFGAFIPSATQNRVADGARLAFAASK